MECEYKILVWNEKYSFENYDDEIFRRRDDDIDYKKELKMWSMSPGNNELKFLWEKMLESYEGYTYCVRDMFDDHIIVGGVFDPGDWEIISDYLYNI